MSASGQSGSGPLPHVPAELKSLWQWINWCRETRKEGKITKVPYQTNGSKASSTDPETWTSFDKAYRGWKKADSGFDGIGFVLTKDDPYIGVDIDHCLDTDRTVLPWAREVVALFEGSTYTEVTPSGTGIRAFVKGVLPKGALKKVAMAEGTFTEMYDSGRYLTITGNSFNGAPPRIAANQGAIDQLAAMMARAKGEPAKTALRSTATETSGKVPEGERHDFLLGEGQRLNKEGYHGEALYEKLTEINRAQLTEPKPVAEVRGIVDWVEANPPTFAFTDLGNAERLIQHHGREVFWCEEISRWYTWAGTHWAPDNSLHVMKLASDTVRGIYAEAARIIDPDIRQAHAKHARASESRARIEAMIALARPMVPKFPVDMDRDHWLLNVENGVLDLRDGKLWRHAREDYITRVCPVAYDAEAQCPRWKKFLAEIFQPHPDIIPFLQRAVGYSLTGVCSEECMFLLHGVGRNGKGTLIKALEAFLGEFAGTADFSTFIAMRDDNRAPRDDVAHMRGRRLVAAQEVREGAVLAETLLKGLTGGDRVRARLLYQNSYQIEPTWKIWLAVNHKPIIKGTDPAIWSRIKLIPFDVSFEGREDKTLKRVLLEELPGILSWAVRGCLLWQKDGLKFPTSVLAATASYRAESDQVGRFLVERTEGQIKASLLYGAYKSWCEDTGEKEVLSSIIFGRRLTELGMEKKTDRAGTFYDVGRWRESMRVRVGG